VQDSAIERDSRPPWLADLDGAIGQDVPNFAIRLPASRVLSPHATKGLRSTR
jgi:hypothetical protein